METIALLIFIMDQELILEDYLKLIPLIREKFTVTRPGCGITDMTELLVRDVIDWEKHPGRDISFEKLINDKFIIHSKTLSHAADN